ncbi:MAG: hypothetical protein ILO34_02780, partial [Kiritimatiellae bacterium]|nr:hypothetical protein [Kiritimatiellia bacterium]
MKAAMVCAFAALAGLCALADVATVEGFTGADHVETLQGSVYSFSDTAGGTLTLSRGGAIDILVVGGGGGGGYDVAGGGGAGGFVYEEDVELPAGTYAIAVGAGGAWATGNSMTGESGGDSSISALSPFEGIVAYG